MQLKRGRVRFSSEVQDHCEILNFLLQLDLRVLEHLKKAIAFGLK